MTSPTGDHEPAGERRASHPRRGEPSVERARDSTSENVHPEEYEYAETALGGADTVQKTSYVTGEGAEPSGAPRAGVVARTTTGGGFNITAWVIGFVAAAVALVYAFGIFR